jgi:organic hydroperoxide reductase OsmC/OhrA
MTIQHDAEIRWERSPGELFTDRRYGRAHTWHFDGGARVAASSSPHAVPVPFSRPEHIDPEEALVAAVASCHMLTFLFLAARQGYVIDAYVDPAIGEMGLSDSGRPALAHVTLRPRIRFSGDRVPDDAAVRALHLQAHDDCVIANSVRAAIEVAGSWHHDATLHATVQAKVQR